MKKLAAAGFVAGAAMGAVLMAGPAQADEQSNENDQLIPVQLCNTNVAVLIGVNSSEAEDCVNGPQQANIDK